VSYAKLPLSFEANQGQTDARVKFLSRGPGYTLFLTGDEAVLGLRRAEARQPKFEKRNSKSAVIPGVPRPLLRGLEPPTRDLGPQTASAESGASAAVRVKLLGANPHAKATGEEELPGKANYFIGNDPKKWRTNLPTYAQVRYQGVYPGVDLVYYGNQGGQLEYDFVVAPGADPSAIALDVGAVREPPRAHRDAPLQSTADGGLVISTEIGPVQLEKPLIYQEDSGWRREIPGGYVLKNAHEVAFRVGAYDPTRPLVIDPVLAYSTYLGGNEGDYGEGIAEDASGNTYVAGSTESSDFPTSAGAFQTALAGGVNVFVTKLNPTGTALVYSTYLGGNGPDYGDGIAVDSSGNAYVTGRTDSTNFPTTAGAFQTALQATLAGRANAFVTKLSPSGSALVYSTYLGGTNFDGGDAIAVDSSGNAYVTGWTASTNFPTTAGAFQTALASPVGYGGNAFVTKLNPTGTAPVYSTYLGGNLVDVAHGIAVDSSGNAYVTGGTRSPNFPTTAGAFQTSLAGFSNAFVTRLNSTGSALVYSTYLGGSNKDEAYGIALDSSADPFVTGETMSSNFPITPGAFQTALAGSENAFVTKLNPAGTALIYSTYLGGSGQDSAYGIAVDSSGNANVTGPATSSNFPTTAGAFQTSLAGTANAFVTTLNASGSALVYSTYLGGSSADSGYGIALDALGNAYVTGSTESSNFPTTTGAFQTSLQGLTNAFVAKFENSAQAQVTNLESTVENLVSTGAINPFVGHFLLAPLNAALEALGPDPATAATAASGRRRTAAAIADLNEFIIEVRVVVLLRALNAAEGHTLINAANSLIGELRG
jgi:hypothetical protein